MTMPTQSPRSSMILCPNCDAPNPSRSDTCYSCGRMLHDAAPPPPPARREPAPSFDAASPLGSEPAMPHPAPPRGWRYAAPLWAGNENCRLCVRRTLMGRVRRDSAAGVAAAFVAVACINGLLPGRRYGASVPAASPVAHAFPVFLLGMIALALIAWVVFGQEELLLDFGALTHRKGCCGVPLWRKSMRGPAASLLVEDKHYWDRSGTGIRRTLLIEFGRTRWTIDRRSWHVGLLYDLFGDNGSGGQGEEVVELAGFVAAVTGWRVTRWGAP